MALTTTIRSALRWARGPATYDDASGAVVMQVAPDEEHFAIEPTDGADVELTRIRRPADAVAFVERFGLLTTGYYGDLFVPLATRQDGMPFDFGDRPLRPDIPEAAREPFDVFAATAADMRDILRGMKLVRAALAGDAEALAALRSDATAPLSESSGIVHLRAEAQSNELLRQVTNRVARQLNAGLTAGGAAPTLGILGQPPSLFDQREAPDRLTLSVQCANLRAFAYWVLAEKLISRDPIVECPECGIDFVVQYSGKARTQRFCSRNCNRRARYRETRGEEEQQ